MENEIKVGDKVRTLEPIGTTPKGTIGIVQKTYIDGAVCLLIAVENGISNIYCWTSELEIVQTKEQMAADAKDTAKHCNTPNLTETELEVLKKDALDKMIHPERQFTYESAMDWVKYEAQLAHDIAVEYIRINRYLPEVLGKNAVNLAKSIVEGLKKR